MQNLNIAEQQNINNIKVTGHVPDSVSDVIRQSKINMIYDILSPNKILRNEKYIGDALLQNTYTTDFLSKKRIKNNGTVPQYHVEGSHEAIIPKDIFVLVQEELVRRRMVYTGENGKCRHSHHSG